MKNAYNMRNESKTQVFDREMNIHNIYYHSYSKMLATFLNMNLTKTSKYNCESQNSVISENKKNI